MEAAAHWVRGGRADNGEAIGDLDAFGGAPPEWVAALEDDEQEMLIEPEAWPVVMAWLRVQTQWRAGMAGAYGLDYAAVDVVLRRARIEDADGAIFEGLQAMEFEAVRLMSAKE